MTYHIINKNNANQNLVRGIRVNPYIEKQETPQIIIIKKINNYQQAILFFSKNGYLDALKYFVNELTKKDKSLIFQLNTIFIGKNILESIN